MKLNQKINPVGIDIPIQDLQTKLHDDLIATLGITSAQYYCYGRVYVNPQKEGLVFETYEGSGEYIEVLPGDEIPLRSFFVWEESSYDDKYAGEISLIVFANLTVLKSLITHRADEEIHKDYHDILRKEPFGFKIVRLVTGINNVFPDYRKLKYDDMQPYHVFKFITELKYQI